MVLNGVHALLEPATLWTEPAAQKPTDNPVYFWSSITPCLSCSYLIRTFPWVIEIFDISPYCFLKIIEVFIKAEDGLSRDVVKHLNHVSLRTSM